MTTIIAVREDKEKGAVCVVADSLRLLGRRKELGGGRFISISPKLFVCGDSIVGIAGIAIWNHAVRNLVANRLNGKSLKDPDSLVDDLFDLPFLVHSLYVSTTKEKNFCLNSLAQLLQMYMGSSRSWTVVRLFNVVALELLDLVGRHIRGHEG